MVALALIAALVAGQVAGSPGVVPDETLLRWDQTAWTHQPLAHKSTTLSHVLWNGSALVDLAGLSWTMLGTVPQVAAGGGGFFVSRAGAGPFSTSNYYTRAAPPAPFDGTAWTLTLVWERPTLAAGDFEPMRFGLYTGTSAGDGVECDAGAASMNCLVTHTQGAQGLICGFNAARSPSIGTWSVSGTRYCVSCNGVAAYSSCGTWAGGGTYKPPTVARFVNLGSYGNNYPFDGYLYEMRFDGQFTELPDQLDEQSRFLGQALIRPAGSALTVSRNGAENYLAGDGNIYAAATSTLAQTATGAQVYGASANRDLQSEALGTTWTAMGTPTLVENQYDLLGTGTTMDRVTIDAVSEGYKQVQSGGAASTAWLHSCWTRADTGTSTESVVAYCPATSVCTCGRSDGGACTAEIIGGTDCSAYATVGAAPVRLWAVATCTSTALAEGRLGPGRYGTDSAAVGGFGGCQLEPGVTRPGPYHATTTGPVTWPASVVSTPTPSRLFDRQGCLGVDFQSLEGSARALGWGANGVITANFYLYDGTSYATVAGSAVSLTQLRGWWGPGAMGIDNLSTGAVGVPVTYDGTMVGATTYLGSNNGASAINGVVRGAVIETDPRGCRRVP